MPFPFELPFDEVVRDLDRYADEVCASLQSGFMTMPKGPGFVEYAMFEQGYEHLKRATGGFRAIEPDTVLRAVTEAPIAVIVLRAMLGFTPSEWADAASGQTGVSVSQGAARSIDRKIRMTPDG